MTAEDVVLAVPGLTRDGDPVVLGKNTEVLIDTIGACHNPRVFLDPSMFKPRRWESRDTTAMDHFIAFSVGPRLCLGRKFSAVEAVCFISHILRDWHFDVKLMEGETRMQWHEKVMQPKTWHNSQNRFAKLCALQTSGIILIPDQRISRYSPHGDDRVRRSSLPLNNMSVPDERERRAGYKRPEDFAELEPGNSASCR